jgi:SAM-dependent methyltransferase
VAAHNLATKSFWEDTYLAGATAVARPSEELGFDRALVHLLERRAPLDPGSSLVEIGCAPAKWMVFYAERFGATVEGIEYARGGVELSRANLAACGVDGVVHHADFWDLDLGRTYDAVFSLGFIEHFDAVDDAFDRHADLLAPGGILILGVPNFRGLTRAAQRWCDPDWLALHNMAAMGHERYVRRAGADGLTVRSVDYFGGFDPDVISTRRRGHKLLAPVWHLRRRTGREGPNAWWLSSYLLMVFERP